MGWEEDLGPVFFTYVVLKRLCHALKHISKTSLHFDCGAKFRVLRPVLLLSLERFFPTPRSHPTTCVSERRPQRSLRMHLSPITVLPWWRLPGLRPLTCCATSRTSGEPRKNFSPYCFVCSTHKRARSSRGIWKRLASLTWRPTGFSMLSDAPSTLMACRSTAWLVLRLIHATSWRAPGTVWSLSFARSSRRSSIFTATATYLTCVWSPLSKRCHSRWKSCWWIFITTSTTASRGSRRWRSMRISALLSSSVCSPIVRPDGFPWAGPWRGRWRCGSLSGRTSTATVTSKSLARWRSLPATWDPHSLNSSWPFCKLSWRSSTLSTYVFSQRQQRPFTFFTKKRVGCWRGS